MNTFYTTFLARLYGEQAAVEIEPRLQQMLQQYRGTIPRPADSSLSERDAILITYGDQIQQEGVPPLKTLAEFCETQLAGCISGIHILPFFPWSSDDGFAVKDYTQVDPALGTWDDIERISHSFRWMVDGVINHLSAESSWFRSFLNRKDPYTRYFITRDEPCDLSKVVRPRTSPLLTVFDTVAGPRKVWTTFSADQVDLDYHQPDVLLAVLDVLLFYARHGAQFLRLDAIAYLWKEDGSTCIHLPQTHTVIQLIRAVLNDLAPHVRLVTETNVPHGENIAYFGDGTNEAQLVYNFALPPLVLHTFFSEDATVLSEWAAKLSPPSNQTTFFNFLASHDGIGLNPVREILSRRQIADLIEMTRAHGGLISYKRNSDGSQSPYELNISYFDALSNPNSREPLSLQADRFLAAQAMMLSLQGVPGIYFHSLFGSRNWQAGVQLTAQNRSINRQKLTYLDLKAELAQPDSLRSQVFRGYQHLLQNRARSAAFAPNSSQQILPAGKHVFALLRSAADGSATMLCLQNVSYEPQTYRGYNLAPYQTLWVKISE